MLGADTMSFQATFPSSTTLAIMFDECCLIYVPMNGDLQALCNRSGRAIQEAEHPWYADCPPYLFDHGGEVVGRVFDAQAHEDGA